jgi:hypothetical protein
MSKEVIYTCDHCNKPMGPQRSATVLIFAIQGTSWSDLPSSFSDKKEIAGFLNKHHCYQDVNIMELCSECLGEKTTYCYGDTAPFGLTENFITRILIKLGWMKEKKQEASHESH